MLLSTIKHYKRHSRLPIILPFIFISCLQPLPQEKIPPYITAAQDVQSSSFSCDNNDLLIVTVSGGSLKTALLPEHFALTREGEIIPVSKPFRSDDNCALLGFDVALPKSNDYRLTVKSDAVIPGEFSQSVIVKPVSSGKFTVFENTNFENDSVNSLCYANGRFIAAGGRGKMAYLTDSGTAWVAINSGEGADGNKFSGAIYGISGGNNRFYAVGEGARMSASFNNGLNWSRPLIKKYNDDSYYFADDLFSGDDIRCVTWGKGASVSGGRFVAAGKNGKLLFEWSPDVWNDEVVHLGENEVNTLVWGDTGAYGTFIAAGSGGSLYRSAIANGKPGTWAEVDSRFDNLDIYSGAFGNGLFVIGGKNGCLSLSSKGDEWKKADSGTDADILALAFGGGVFVAAGDRGFMSVSVDGISWEALTDSGFDQNDMIKAVASDGRGKFIASSYGGGKTKIVYWYQKPAL